LALLYFPNEGSAASIFTVTMDTTSLVGVTGLAIDFQLVDGDGAANSSVVLGEFDFGVGGQAIGVPLLIGGATGNLDTMITLTDTGFFNAFTQEFAAGTLLSFTVTLTADGIGLPAPDRFAFSVLDSAGFPIPTTGLADEFVGLDLIAPLTWSTAGTDPARTTIQLEPPIVQPAEVVPEPGSLLLCATGLLYLGSRARRAWSFHNRRHP